MALFSFHLIKHINVWNVKKKNIRIASFDFIKLQKLF